MAADVLRSHHSERGRTGSNPPIHRGQSAAVGRGRGESGQGAPMTAGQASHGGLTTRNGADTQVRPYIRSTAPAGYLMAAAAMARPGAGRGARTMRQLRQPRVARDAAKARARV